LPSSVVRERLVAAGCGASDGSGVAAAWYNSSISTTAARRLGLSQHDQARTSPGSRCEESPARPVACLPGPLPDTRCGVSAPLALLEPPRGRHAFVPSPAPRAARGGRDAPRRLGPDRRERPPGRPGAPRRQGEAGGDGEDRAPPAQERRPAEAG